MSDPSYALQAAIVARLKGDTGMRALIDDRVFDEIPPHARFPYANISGGQVNGNDVDCAAISEIYFQIHAWARPPKAGSQIKSIAGAIRDAMAPALAVVGFDVEVQDFQQMQWLDDPDGLTRHAVVEFRFIIVHT